MRPPLGGLSRRRWLAAAPLFLAVPGRGVAAPAVAPRVAVLDWSLAETMLALGAVPLAVGEAAGYRAWLPAPELPAGSVDLGLLTEPNLELLARLAPDLILLGNGQESAAGLLGRIAPTRAVSIYTGDGAPLAGARAAALELARLLDRDEAGTRLLRRADLAMAAARERLTAAQRTRPLLVFVFGDDRHGWVADANGLVQGVLDELGLVNGWRAAPSFWGFSAIGIDGLATVPDAGIIYADFALPDSAGALASPLWQALPAVRAGRTGVLPRFWYFGGLPTAMRLAEQLAAAAAAMPPG